MFRHIGLPETETEMLNVINSYINNRYGSRRGLLSSVKFELLSTAGYMNELKAIDFSRVEKLIFICSGNICRSPIGEYYARYLGLDAESYGLHCRGNDPVDPRTNAYMERLSLSLHCHVTRNLNNYRPSTSDLILVMEPNQVKIVADRVGLEPQITLVPLWLNRPKLYLHDPYTTNEFFFKKCADQILESTKNVSGYING